MDQECSVSIANSRCHQNQCQCNTGYKPESDLTVCKLFALGSSCTYTEDCDTAVPNSQCTENKCECSSGYWPIGGKCINGKFAWIHKYTVWQKPVMEKNVSK